MALIKNMYYTYRDVTIVPGVVSEVEHRNECVPFDEDGMLPLFTAPMDTVVNKKNYDLFNANKIIPILPRTEKFSDRISYALDGKWAAFSLQEFEKTFCSDDNEIVFNGKIRVLIDIANGHMKKMLELVKIAKEKFGDNIVIMAGNIANPKAYIEYAKVGVDYVRCGIGSGFGCLSTSNTGVHMPMASLIDEIHKLKPTVSNWVRYNIGDYKSVPKIIADGGIRGYSDIIKALALGADYVMVGSVFAKMLESAADKTSDMYSKIDFTNGKFTMDKNFQWRVDYENEGMTLGEIKAVFYGMASREGQIALSGKKTKTSEGIRKVLRVEYTMNTWVENFTDYLRSAMSYAGHKTLESFRYDTDLIINSENSIEVVNK